MNWPNDFDGAHSVSGAPYGTGSRPMDQAPSGLDAQRVDPSRVAEAVSRPDIVERKAVSRFLTVQAARSFIYYQELPGWAWFRRRKYHWTMVANTIAAASIERGEHLDEQANWLNDIRGGAAILDGIAAAIASAPQADRNPKGGDSEAAPSRSDESGGPAQQDAPENQAISTTPPEIAA